MSGKAIAKSSILADLLTAADPDEGGSPEKLVAGGELLQHARQSAARQGYPLTHRSAQNALGDLVRDGIVTGPVKATKQMGYGRLSWRVKDFEEAERMWNADRVESWIMNKLVTGETVTLTFPLNDADMAAFVKLVQHAKNGGLTVTAKADNPSQLEELY